MANTKKTVLANNPKIDSTLLRIEYESGFVEYVVAWGYDNKAESWANGKYFENEVEAKEWYELNLK